GYNIAQKREVRDPDDIPHLDTIPRRFTRISDASLLLQRFSPPSKLNRLPPLGPRQSETPRAGAVWTTAAAFKPRPAHPGILIHIFPGAGECGAPVSAMRLQQCPTFGPGPRDDQSWLASPAGNTPSPIHGWNREAGQGTGPDRLGVLQPRARFPPLLESR